MMNYRDIRRAVTGHDANGTSVYIKDGVPPRVYTSPVGARITDIWSEPSLPISNAGNADPTEQGAVELKPPPNGFTFRMLELPPDSQRDFASVQKYFEGMGAGHGVRDQSGRHPAMHKTQSLDICVIISGEIWSLMEDGEVLLKAGDVLVQRGTNHAFSNRSDQPCLLAGVLFGAHPLPAK